MQRTPGEDFEHRQPAQWLRQAIPANRHSEAASPETFTFRAIAEIERSIGCCPTSSRNLRQFARPPAELQREMCQRRGPHRADTCGLARIETFTCEQQFPAIEMLLQRPFPAPAMRAHGIKHRVTSGAGFRRFR